MMDVKRRRRLRRFVYGADPEPVPSYLGLVEDPEKGKLGICCSGGGIRSAAFNLGALQWLQQEGQLQKASYLSAVSGGSYIAAAFSMVAKTWPAGQPRPVPRKAGEDDSNAEGEENSNAEGNDNSHPEGEDDSNPELLNDQGPFAKESPEEQYLRNHSSYMAPDMSALTYVVFRALLGLAFNLVFVSLPLFGAGMLLGELVYRPHLPHLVGNNCGSNCKPGVGWWWVVPTALLALAVLLALAGMLSRTRDDEGAFLRTWSVRLLLCAVLFAFLMLATPALVAIFHHSSVQIAAKSSGAPKNGGVVAGTAGLAALVLGVLAQLREALVTPKKDYEELEKGGKWLRSLSSGTKLAIAYIAGGLIGPALLAGAYVYGVSVALANSPHGPRAWVFVVGVAAIALFVLLYSVADITSWSLHPFYKRRLCTAFALKRVYPTDLIGKEANARERTLAARERARVEMLPSKGKAKGTPIAVERDYDKLVKLSETAVTGREWPTLLVCAAANISDQGATPPGRKVTSFTFSANTVGGPLVGALPTKTLEKAFTESEGVVGKLDAVSDWLRDVAHLKRRRTRVSDFSLPAAVAMSGAAISPSMGKLTRRPFRFLLALANIRLGVWVPNPRWVDEMGNKQTGWFGRPRPVYLFNEMIGRNRIGAKYLYVTDGGHYENLGLVELLRRGCRQIYCFDASGGEGFEALGDAIALARSELGVEIGGIRPGALFPEKATDDAKQTVTHVDFRYPKDGPGDEPCRLVYAHNVLTEGSPWDVLALHKADRNFPHNSTLDQLYTDQKFEGYRVLGERAGEAAVERMKRSAAGESAGR